MAQNPHASNSTVASNAYQQTDITAVTIAGRCGQNDAGHFLVASCAITRAGFPQGEEGVFCFDNEAVIDELVVVRFTWENFQQLFGFGRALRGSNRLFGLLINATDQTGTNGGKCGQ